MYAAITADVVASTSLSRESLVELSKHIKESLPLIEKKYDGVWCRFIKGDCIECIIDHPENAYY